MPTATWAWPRFIETKRENLPAVLELLRQIARAVAAGGGIGAQATESLADLEEQLTDPQSLAISR